MKDPKSEPKENLPTKNTLDDASAYEFYESHNVMRLLKISESTLYRYRKQKLIAYTKLGGKYLYPKISIKNLIHKAMNQQ
jgi:hypothetical protein